MKTFKQIFAFVAAVVCTVVAEATISTPLQIQLGNPTNAQVEPTNHDHYLLQRPQYSLDYSDNHGEPNWVSWDLTSADVGASGRSGTFMPDPLLPPTFYALVTGDYTGSGYDRGHMTPSADRTVTVEDNQATFYLSNILPQAPDNNQGVWARFESDCRDLAAAGNELLITSGGSVFSGSRIPSGKAAIPGYTWKIVVVVPLGPGSAVDRITSSTRVIAIKVPNIAGVRSTPWQNFVTSINQVEADTGFHFLTNVPAAVATALKAVVDGQSAAGSPSVTSQPNAQTTVVGGSATFSVSAVGDDPLSYQWFLGDTEIPGATSATLTLSNLQASDVGNYYVVVSNLAGSATSNAAALIITGLPPTISTSPASQSVNAGSSVTFSVAASGSPTLSYQWRKNAAPLTGATSASLTLANVQSADAGSFDVIVTNSVNSVASSAATLTVNAAAPTITGEPASKTVSTGGNAGFSVTATGSAPLTYQWRKNGAALADVGTISGSSSPTLVLTGASAVDGGDYDVVVTNALGTATSLLATLTVNPPPPSMVVWEFAVDGSPSVGTADPTRGLTADIAGGTFTQGNNNGATPLLTTTSASTPAATFSGTFNVGAATANGALNKTTSTYFQFTLTPSAGKRLLASGLTFGERRTGTGPLAYDVYSSVDNYAAPLATGTFANDTNWHVVTTSFAAVTSATGTPITFRIYGYNGTGAAANTAVWRLDDVKLTVTAVFPPPVPPVVTATSPSNNAASVAIGAPLTITFNEAVAFTGSWFSITSALQGPIAAAVTGGPTTFTLAPPSAFANNDTVSVTIFGGQVVDQASGTIHGTSDTTFSFTTESYVSPTPATVTAQPVAQTVNAGATVAFTVGASGTAPLVYQWRKEGVPIGGNSSASTATLTLTNVGPASAGNYDCIVSNLAGSDVSHTAALVVNLVLPTIGTAPTAQSAQVNGQATFTVVAAGTGPFAYQWRKGGIPLSASATITGVDQSSLGLSALTGADSGAYDVVITSAAGTVTSVPVALAVLSAAASDITWNFNTAEPTSGLPVGITGGGVTQGNNNGTTALLTTTSASGTYANASGGNNAGAAARVGPLNQNASGSAYVEFTLIPAPGRQVAATGISFGMRSTGTGPQAYALFSSVDNFTAPLGTGPIANTGVWAKLTPAFTGVIGASGAPVTFRLFGYAGSGGAAASTANWRIDDLTLTAGLLAAPAVAPSVVSISPAANATGVAPDAAITVTFNEAVDVNGSWYSLTGSTSGAIGATASGGPATSFTLTPSTSFAPGETVTLNLVGGQIVDHSSGTLSLSGNPSVSFTVALPLPPVITSSPASQIATVGDAVSFAVAASGAGPLTYQWRKDASPLADNPSAKTATLALGSVTVSDQGAYDCVVSNAGGSVASSAATLTVNRAVAAVTLGSLSSVYTGASHRVTATTVPVGLNVVFTYQGSSAAPVNVGTYAVVATVSDINYTGTATGILTIAPAPASVALSGLTQLYDGAPKPVTALVTPEGLPVTVTYDGSATPPTYPGSYAVVASVTGGNFAGGATGTLTIENAIVVRHAPTLNGGVDGSVQVLLPESITLNSSTWLAGELMVPGTPTIRVTTLSTYGGTIDGPGESSPTTAVITLNSGAVVRHVVRRINPTTLPAVAAPPAPTGTRDVSLNGPVQAYGDPATFRNLTVNSNVNGLSLPAGTYGTFVMNSNSSLTLGVPGSTVPAVYNLQGLTLNGSSRIDLVGPVILNVASSVTINGTSVGNAAHPEWLQFTVASGGLTLNSNVVFRGYVLAPTGTVTVNSGSEIVGGVLADRLTINGNGNIDTRF